MSQIVPPGLIEPIRYVESVEHDGPVRERDISGVTRGAVNPDDKPAIEPMELDDGGGRFGR